MALPVRASSSSRPTPPTPLPKIRNMPWRPTQHTVLVPNFLAVLTD
jgi:hypothetical protein